MTFNMAALQSVGVSEVQTKLTETATGLIIA